mgnify:CR=1 FL=1
MKPVYSAAFAAMIVAAAVTATARDAAWSAEKKYGPGVSDTEIKIGQTIAYSGPASSFGTIGHTISAYYRMINDRGGINGRKINFISADDGYSPPKTVEQTRRLVEQEQVLAIVGSLGSPTNASVQRYLNDRKVPQLFLFTGAARFRDPQTWPVDDGRRSELRQRDPRLRPFHHGRQAGREDRHPLSERRLRQGPHQRSEVGPRRQGEATMIIAEVPYEIDRSDGRFRRSWRSRPRGPMCCSTSHCRNSPPRPSARSTTSAGSRCTSSASRPPRSR